MGLRACKSPKNLATGLSSAGAWVRMQILTRCWCCLWGEDFVIKAGVWSLFGTIWQIMKLFWLVLSQASALVKHDEKLEILADENFDQMRGFGNYAPCVTEIDTIFTNATLIVNTSKSNTSGRIELVNYQGLSLFSVSCCTKFYRYLNPVVQKWL